MQDYFYALAERLHRQLQQGERLLTNYQGEVSDFVRLNHCKIRQAGHVTQHYLTLELIQRQSHLSASLALCGDESMDLASATAALDRLRQQLPHVPDDPYLNLPSQPTYSERDEPDLLPEAAVPVSRILQLAQGLDLVGYWASGAIHQGMTDSLGSCHWQSTHSFNVDWSCYQHEQAVKNNYAGRQWNEAAFINKLDRDRQALDILQRKPVTLTPGSYRAYLAPAAMEEIIGMLGWGDFGLKSQQTRRSALLQLVEGEKVFDSKVTLVEASDSGLAATFTEQGFVVDQPVPLVEQGRFSQALVSPRSAIEYRQPVNCAYEAPQSLTMQPGALADEDILQALDTGVYISNLWYCNYSDRNHGRITGMTRFASYWVERGKVIGPLSVIRFDDTLYRMLGENLLELTAHRETSISPSSYDHRSSSSATLPGGLLREIRLTL